jgi:hypothetical protein
MQMTALSHERPFPGLRPFGFADHPFFFGRDDQVYAVYRLLDRSRFIAVVGTSGGGKSSLVRAGLLPLLHRETMESGGRNWKCFELRPGDSPISSLTDALAGPPPVGSDENKCAIHAARRERIAYAFRHSSFGLVEAIPDLNDVEGCSIILLVDQFEELFRFSSIDRTANRDPAEEARRREEAAQFVQLLLEASRSQEPKIHVLITMRSDFIGDCARFHGLPEAVSATQFLVPSLTRDQREEVIRKPIEKAEATIDGTLVEQLLNDSNDEFDLPVLQHCLMRLWEKSGLAATPTDIAAAPAESDSSEPRPRHLRLEHYDEVGRIARALSLHADAIMASLAGLEVAVEQTFRALSDVDKDGRATRRALSFRQLLEETGVPENELRQVVDRFRGEDCSFLVPPPSVEATLTATTRVDVGHESLLRRWEQVCSGPTAEFGAPQAKHTGWLAVEEVDGRTYRAVLALIDSAPPGSRATLPLDQVEARTKWWKSRKRTEAWAERYGGGLDRVQQLFQDSHDALEAEQQREQAAREAQREREIKAAKMRRNITWGSIAAALVLAVVAGVAVIMFLQARESEQHAQSSAQQAKAAQKTATENESRAPTALSDAALANRRVVQVQQIARQTGGGSGGIGLLLLAVHAVTLQPNDGLGLLGAIDGVRQQLRAAAGLPLDDGQVADVVSGADIDPNRTPQSRLATAYSPDLRWLAIGSADGLVRLHDLTAADPRTAARDLAGHNGPVAGLVFAPDGRHLVSAGSDGTLRLWQVDAAPPVAGRVISVTQGPIRALAASLDGQWLAFGAESGQLCLWRWLADGPEEAPCDPAWRDELPVTTVMFSAKGRWLATTCTGACKAFNAPVRLWDLCRGRSVDRNRSSTEEYLTILRCWPSPSRRTRRGWRRLTVMSPSYGI